MNDAACSVHVIEAEEDLLGDLTDEPDWDTLGLMSLDESQKVLTEDLKYHANVVPIGSFVTEMIEEGDDMRPTRMGRIRGDEPLEELDLVEGSLRISCGRLYDLECNVAVHPTYRWGWRRGT